MGNILLIDPRTIRPLPKSLWGATCAWCDKRQSRWELLLGRDQDAKIVCSVCMLYDSAWSSDKQQEIEQLIVDIESGGASKFLRDPLGRLVPSRADQVMAAIAMTSRMFRLGDYKQRMKAKVMDEGSGS